MDDFLYGPRHDYRRNVRRDFAVRFFVVKRGRRRIWHFDCGQVLDAHGQPTGALYPKDATAGRIAFVVLDGAGVGCDRHNRLYFATLAALRAWQAAPVDALALLKAAMVAAHPDKGGSATAFIAARARYVAARERDRSRWWTV